MDEIKRILSAEFVCCGYRKVSVELKSADFIIHHKNGGRLMDENSFGVSALLMGGRHELQAAS